MEILKVSVKVWLIGTDLVYFCKFKDAFEKIERWMIKVVKLEGGLLTFPKLLMVYISHSGRYASPVFLPGAHDMSK